MSRRPPGPLLAGALALVSACAAASKLTAQSSPRITPQEIILELDKVAGTDFPPKSVMDSATGRRVTLANLYAASGATGLEVQVIHDRTDMPASSPWTIQELDQLLHYPQDDSARPAANRGARNRDLEAMHGAWYLHQLVVDGKLKDEPDVVGIIFDRGERVGTAVFHGTLQGRFGALGAERVRAEMFLTSVHETGHSLNLHHADWEGSEFKEGSTIMGYSSAVTVLWTFSPSSVAHLARTGDHPVDFVKPGPFGKAFGTIAYEHCDAHPHPTHSAGLACH